MKEFQGKQPNQFQLPDQISRLGELAYNLWWVWEKEAQKALFAERYEFFRGGLFLHQLHLEK